MEECEFENNETEGDEEGGAIRYFVAEGNLQDNNTFNNNRPNSIRYNKSRYPDGKATGGKTGKGGCWAVSAYFGDAAHPDVSLIRTMRDDMIVRSRYGHLMAILDRLYQWLGTSEFGSWWRSQLMDEQAKASLWSPWPRRVTGECCRMLRWLARWYWH